MTDHDLLRAYLQRSDEDSLGAFFGRYQDLILRFVSRLLGDPEAAQDVVQETFLQVAKRPGRLLQVESCHNWLLRVARNKGMDHIRRVSRQRKYTKRFAEQQQSIQAQNLNIADPLVHEETQNNVRARIEDLPARQKEVLLLRIQEKKTYREIAEICGLSATNVGFILHQAMKSLSTQFKQDGLIEDGERL